MVAAITRSVAGVKPAAGPLDRAARRREQHSRLSCTSPAGRRQRSSAHPPPDVVAREDQPSTWTSPTRQLSDVPVGHGAVPTSSSQAPCAERWPGVRALRRCDPAGPIRLCCRRHGPCFVPASARVVCARTSPRAQRRSDGFRHGEVAMERVHEMTYHAMLRAPLAIGPARSVTGRSSKRSKANSTARGSAAASSAAAATGSWWGRRVRAARHARADRDRRRRARLPAVPRRP